MSTDFGFDFDGMTDKIKEKEDTGYKADPRLYVPVYKKNSKQIDEEQAILRLLPTAHADIPYVKRIAHTWIDAQGTFHDFTCKKTFGWDNVCPFCDALADKWDDLSSKQQGDYRRKTNYYTNIVILRDVNTPENRGKMFVFKYGKVIHDKIMEIVSPDAGGIKKPNNIFHPVTGQNFEFISKKTQRIGKNLVQNYDACSFSAPSPLVGGDVEKIKLILSRTHNINDFVDADNYPSDAEMVKLIAQCFGGAPAQSQQTPVQESAPAVTVDLGDDLGDLGDLDVNPVVTSDPLVGGDVASTPLVDTGVGDPAVDITAPVADVTAPAEQQTAPVDNTADLFGDDDDFMKSFQ